MDSDNMPSTSSRAKYLKYVSDKLNASNNYPVAFDEFRKLTNVDEYVVREMKRSGPDIWRINYHIRHEYYPIVYKKFYQSRSVREKMIRRGLTIKPIPKFLKERLMQMPGEDAVQTNMNMKSSAANSPAYKTPQKSKNAVKKSTDKAMNTPKVKRKSKLEKEDKNKPTDSNKITHFFSALKLVKNVENLLPVIDGVNTRNTRKRKTETKETSPVIKRLRDGVAPKDFTKESKDKGPHFGVNRNSIGLKSRRNTINGRMQEHGKNLNKSQNSENRRKTQKSPFENLPSDDSDIYSNVEIVDTKETQNVARQSVSFTKSSSSSLLKSPLPKRNRVEDFQKPSLSPRKSTQKKYSQLGSDQRQSSSDAEMALLSLSGAVKKTKTTTEVSREIQDWLSKAVRSVEEESDDESAISFLEEDFLAVDKLKAIGKYPDDVRNYIKYLLNAEIQRRKIANLKPEKRDNVSKSKVLAAFRGMTFDDYTVLINADKIFSQRLSERKTPQEVTSDLRAQYEATIHGKRAWPRDQYVKLSTLRNFLRSKGLQDPVDLKYIPPRLLSFEEVLEHTNLKECTSLSRSQPPGSYKQLLSLCKQTYLKCCLEGVWVDGLHFTDSIDWQEEFSQLTQLDSTPPFLPSAEEPANISTSGSAKNLDKNRTSSNEKEASEDVQGHLLDNVCIPETQENPSNNTEAPTLCDSENDVEKMLDKMFAESEPEVAQSKETSEEISNQIDAEQEIIKSLYAPASEMLPVSQPVLGFIPPSPALFQSTDESDQRTQNSDSQQVGPHPAPEAVFIPCDRSMMLNTEENNLTVESVDHESGSQDPFAEASRNPEARKDDTPVQATIEDTPVIEVVVKKEPEWRNNTQTSYNPFDDSVQILDIPPSEPIVVDDEESAPELLDMLLTRPSPKKSDFVPPISPQTQSSACMETFVHAQQLPSNLSSTQSELNPSQPHEESRKEGSITESEKGEEKSSDSLSPISDEVKAEKEPDIEAEIEQIDIDVILNILKTDSEDSQNPPGRKSLQCPEHVNESRPQENVSSPKANDVDLTNRDNQHDHSVKGHQDKNGSVAETSCVSIPPQQMPTELESSLNVVETIPILASTLEATQEPAIEIAKSVIAVNQEDPAPSEKTEVANEIQCVREEECIEEVVGAMNDAPGTLPSVNVIPLKNVTSENVRDAHDGASGGLNEDGRSEIEKVESMDLQPLILTEENRTPVQEIDNQQSDVNLKDAVEEQPSSGEMREYIPSDVKPSASPSLAGEILHLGGFQDAPSSLPGVDTEPHVEHVQNNANSETIVGEILNQSELFVGCNIEVNTIVPETEISAIVSQIELMQVSEEDNQVETVAVKIVEQTSISDQKEPLENQQGATSLSEDAKDGGEGESKRQDVVSAEEGAEPATHAGTEENPLHNLGCGESSKELDELVQKGEEQAVCEEAVPNQSLETNLCSKVTLNAVESNVNHLGIGSQQSLAATSPQISSITRSEHQREISSNTPVNAEDRIQILNSTESPHEPSHLPLTTATLKPNKKKTFVFPALLPIAALKCDKIDEFIENAGMGDEPDIDDEKDDLVEVPVLINRRFIQMLPFSIVTPQEIQQTTKESTVHALKMKLELCLEGSGIPDGDGENVSSKNEAVPILKQIVCPTKQKNTVEVRRKDNTETVFKPESAKRCIRSKKTTKMTVGNLKANSCTSVANNECSAKVIKSTQSISNRRKKISPKKVVKKPSALDFVPQKTHAFRSLSLEVTKKNPPATESTQMQTNAKVPSKTEESNYNIEDASQVVASSTASQILGTDCTYFESSQLLRNIEGCCPPAAVQGPPEEQQEPSTNPPKVNTFDRISLSEGLTARRVWQVNLNWRTRQKMSIEVRFSFNKQALTVCNSSAQLLFNFSSATWSDILRVLREIDHFEYKRSAVKNYQAPTPLHKVLRYLFDSAPQIANVKLAIDSHNPYASCEMARPLYRKPFKCLTKAIAPNILSRMKALKDSLRDNVVDE